MINKTVKQKHKDMKISKYLVSLVVLLVEEGYAFGNARRGGKRHGRGEGRKERGLTNTLEHSFFSKWCGVSSGRGFKKNTASMVAESLASHS